MDKKPEWVPDSVWSEYVELIRNDPLCSAVSRAAYEKIIRDPGAAAIWRAIDGKRPYGLCFGPVQFVLVNAVVTAMSGDLKHSLPAGERKASGQKIAKLAETLGAELRKLPAFPAEISSALYDHLAEPMELAHLAGHRWRRVKNPEVIIAMLEDLAQGAKAYACSKPLVAQPRSPDALRLAFIHRMTRLFRDAYGKPLREATAALTSCLFDCEMDASTVSKLAP